MAACPPSEQLRGFASRVLSDDVAAAVESHIETCNDCRSSLAMFAKGSGLGDPQDPPPDAQARIGKRLGRYRVDRVLGMGGMGIVYAAWDPQLDRPVAIKVVHRAAADAAGRARLVREAQSMARLSHSNVCHVYDVGTEPSEGNLEGDVWVAMELIDGTTLRDWAPNKLPQQVMHVLLGAGEGIAAAHAAGMIHRDIKPENVLVTRDGRPVVTDFGLARLDLPVDPSAATQAIDPLRTATNAIVGTPAYLAPEQLTGGVLDARVDQFAWAVMAWELLAGVRPFPAIPIVRLDAIIAGPKAPASLPKPLAAALARAMAAAPRDRYSSLRELLDAVKPAATAKPRRSGAIILAAGAAVVAVAATIIVWKLATSSESTPTTIAVAPPVIAPPVNSLVAPPPAPTKVAIATAPRPDLEPQIAAIAAPARPATHSKPAKVAPTKLDPTAVPSKTDPKEVGPAPTRPATAPKKAPDPDDDDDAAPASGATGNLETFLARHPYDKSRAVSVLDAFCRIPVDPAKPDPKLGRPIADWGRVTRRELATLKLGNRSELRPLYEVKGFRGTYRFTADHWENTVGVMDAKVGQWVVLCVDQMSDRYELPANWQQPLAVLTAMVPVSRAPRVDEIAKLNPLHEYDLAFRRDGGYGKTSLDTSRRFLVRAKVEGKDGNRYDMSQWWIDVPPGTPGGGQVAVGKRLWFVVEKLTFEDQADGSKPRLVVRAVHVLDDLFP